MQDFTLLLYPAIAVFTIFPLLGLVTHISHYYYGITTALLMIFALAILLDIYRSSRWRTVYIVLNSVALLLFVGQSITGMRSLLEIPLHWQDLYIKQLYEYQCETKPCLIQPRS